MIRYVFLIYYFNLPVRIGSLKMRVKNWRRIMKTVEQKLENFTLSYPLERIAPLEKCLFLDIETTGFTAKSSSLYLIGCAYFKEDNWYIRQWFAESPEEEAELLIAFFEFAKPYSHLFHFNGNNFDLPFLSQKCAYYQFSYRFDHFQGIDIYKRTSPYKYFLKLPNCKQKTLELFLGINRTDQFHGGELIDVYHEYVKRPSAYGYHALLQHNFDDMKGMLSLLPVLSYDDLFNGDLHAKKVQANYYKDINDEKHQEVLIKLKLTSPLPVAVSFSALGCYFSGNGLEGTLKVPLYEEEMKYFYANFRDYYYLPDEDLAMHKSVSAFVDSKHRTQASATNCYTRKYSLYLPQWEIVFKPFFKRDYKSKELFFELTEEFKKDREAFTVYAKHILNTLASTY